MNLVVKIQLTCCRIRTKNGALSAPVVEAAFGVWLSPVAGRDHRMWRFYQPRLDKCNAKSLAQENTTQNNRNWILRFNPVNQREKKLEVMENALEVAVGQIAVILCFGSINKQNARRTQSKWQWDESIQSWYLTTLTSLGSRKCVPFPADAHCATTDTKLESHNTSRSLGSLLVCWRMSRRMSHLSSEQNNFQSGSLWSNSTKKSAFAQSPLNLHWRTSGCGEMMKGIETPVARQRFCRYACDLWMVPAALEKLKQAMSTPDLCRSAMTEQLKRKSLSSMPWKSNTAKILAAPTDERELTIPRSSCTATLAFGVWINRHSKAGTVTGKLGRLDGHDEGATDSLGGLLL